MDEYAIISRMITRYNDIKNYTTKDGSIIRELMHPIQHGNNNQSVAEAIIPSGTSTLKHLHKSSEEIYHVKKGTGIMSLGDEHFPICAGDTIYIPPNTPHNVYNEDKIDLVILCACSPAYSHDDTVLVNS